MEFIYNNRSYYINKLDNLSLLLAREELLLLPLSAWKDLFMLKDGYVDRNKMITVLNAVIDYYDSSLEVNSFLFNNSHFWLDKSTRVGLVNLVNSSTDTISLALGDQIISIPVNVAKQFLANLEVYAGKCYINTAKHKIAIKELKTVDDIINYNYTTGYPEKISFNL